MKIKKYLKYIAVILLIALKISNLDITTKTEFNKLEAEKLLRQTYKPLEDFAKESSITKDKKFLLPPKDIKNQEDFIDIFNEKIKRHELEGFYKDLIIKKNGQLYVDSLAYIPSIYTKDGKVRKAYIEKRKGLLDHFLDNKSDEIEKLVIKESWMISGQWHKRSNHFIKNQNGEWILDHFNGTSYYGFVNANNNPWNKYREVNNGK